MYNEVLFLLALSVLVLLSVLIIVITCLLIALFVSRETFEQKVISILRYLAEFIQ